jgi:hypothetical protein
MLPYSDLRQITFPKVNDTSLDQDTVTGYSDIHYIFFSKSGVGMREGIYPFGIFRRLSGV